MLPQKGEEFFMGNSVQLLKDPVKLTQHCQKKKLWWHAAGC